MNTLRVFLFSIILILLFMTGTVSAWVDGYNYRMPINVTGGASGVHTDFTLLLNVTYNGHMQADFDDLRFGNDTHLIYAWLESNTTDYAIIHVEFPTTPANNINQTYYMYYGNTSKSSDWNGDAISLLYDDFNDDTINNSIWTTNIGGGSPTFEETGGYLKILASGAGDTGSVWSDNNFSDASFRYRYKAPDDSNCQVHASDIQGHVSQNGERLLLVGMSSIWKFDKCVAGSYSDIGSVSHDTINWWIGEICRNTTLARVFLNNVQVGSDQTVNAGAKYIMFRAQQSSELHIDWVLVTKYVTNPPTYEFGSEENSGNIAPLWGNQSQNISSIAQGESILLSANGQDITGLNYAWLSTNETGVWQNFTDVDGIVDDYQILSQTYLGVEECCGTFRVTGYSEIAGDYSKFLFHHTPHGTPGQVIGWRYYYPGNDTWGTDHIAYDADDSDASSLTVINATRWMYSFRDITSGNLYDIWTNDSGATWTSPVASPFDGATSWVKYIPIDNDTSKVFVFWRPTADASNLHQKFFYLENESYSADIVAWAIASNDEEITGKIVLADGTYYAHTSSDTGYAQYRTSTDVKTWSGSISSGVSRYNGWGYSVDCNDNYCYMTQVHTDRENRFYSINKSLLNTTGWTYRLDLNVSNLGLPTLKVINNTHIITTSQNNVAQNQYARLVKTHTITESKYGSPIKFDGSTNWEWANFTWSNSDYSDTTIYWKICFNDTSGLANCTDVMSFEVHGDEPIITLLSQTPSIIYKNSTGYLNISYGISHNSSGLNNTSVSFIYRNYDWDLSDSNHSIRPPANDLASVWNFNSRILRATNRNETPGLNFENNDTITGGDTYTWSGLDENSTKLTIVPVSSTYTKIYINATIHCIMPQMWYLDRTDQQQATKTQLAIHKTSNVLIKFWNFEIYKGNYDFLGVGYTDTLLSSNPALWPSDANPVNFYYVNSSYDPATGGDPITSGYAVYMGSLNTSGWTDHVYSRSNSNYVRGFIDNNYLHTVINTTNISYLYFTSNTPSSHPFYINMTNAASSTNRSFANTNTLWAGNNPPYTPQLYTPNVWFAFMKLNMSLDHKLYVADNNDLWGSSSMSRTNITQALFPPTTPTINHFHFLGETDYDMDGVYFGNFSIGCGVSSDPDGGDVTHNLTLHYANNLTFVTIINNTFTDKDITHNGVYFDANFSSIPYYSDDVNYTLRLIATDDESESVTVWLNKCFTLSITPIITSYTPSTPTKTIRYDNQTFTININQIVNVTWYIDGSVVSTENNTNYSSYSNSTAPIDIYNVTAHVENINGTRQQVWDWEVEDPIYSALIQLQADIDDMKKVQTIIQALILLVIGVVVGVVSQRRRYNDEDSEKPIESKNN